jgi:hypothetical protein
MDRPELMIHLAALEPLRLELVISLQPLDRFTELVEITDGLAIAVGTKEPLHSLRYYGHVLERISELVQSFQVVPSSAAILGRHRPPPGGAQRNRTTGIKR